MPAETLNIEYHTRRLLLKALNTRKTKVQAYLALGITEKQLYNLIHRYEVYKKDGKYYSDQIIIFRHETPTNVPAVSNQT